MSKSDFRKTDVLNIVVSLLFAFGVVLYVASIFIR